MWRSVWRVAAASAAWAVVHSVLASRPVKRWVAARIGERNRNGWYRPTYVLQSAVTLAALGAYTRRLPDRTLYEARGATAALLRGAQLAVLIAAVWAAGEAGIGELSGVRPLAEWAAAGPVPAEAEGQGPRPDEGGLRIEGPFRSCRNPLNLLAPLLFWLQPRMTAKWVAWCAVATAYAVLGSVLTERRMRSAYGEAFVRYQESGCPLLLPHLHVLPAPADHAPGPELAATTPAALP